MKDFLFRIRLLFIISLVFAEGGIAQNSDTADFRIMLEEQSRFDFSWKLDGPLLIGGAALVVAGELMKNSIDPLTDAQILALDRNNVPTFDRRATYQNREAHDGSSDITLGIAILTPLTLLISRSVRNDYLPVFAMYLETGAVVNGLTNISKGLTHRTRPYVYNPEVPIDKKKGLGARHSFWSGHVSNTAAFSFLTAYMVSRYADYKILKITAWSGALAVPAVVGYLRYSAGKHFPTDVIVGYIVGAGTGFIIPYVHRKQLPKDTSWEWKIAPYPGGVSVAASF